MSVWKGVTQVVAQPPRHTSHDIPAMHARRVRRRDLTRHQLAGGDGFTRAVGGAQEDAGGGAEGGA